MHVLYDHLNLPREQIFLHILHVHKRKYLSLLFFSMKPASTIVCLNAHFCNAPPVVNHLQIAHSHNLVLDICLLAYAMLACVVQLFSNLIMVYPLSLYYTYTLDLGSKVRLIFLEVPDVVAPD